jgi:hypothetical protein
MRETEIKKHAKEAKKKSKHLRSNTVATIQRISYGLNFKLML